MTTTEIEALIAEGKKAALSAAHDDCLLLSDLADALECTQADLEAVAVALLTQGTLAANTGWRCTMCHGVGEEKSSIKHYDPCPLARPGVKAVLPNEGEG